MPLGDTQAFLMQAKALVTDMAHVGYLRHAARHAVKDLTWERIMGQMEAVLINTVHVQRAKHEQPELAAAAD